MELYRVLWISLKFGQLPWKQEVLGQNHFKIVKLAAVQLPHGLAKLVSRAYRKQCLALWNRVFSGIGSSLAR